MPMTLACVLYYLIRPMLSVLLYTVMHIGKKTTFLYSSEIFNLYRRQEELSQELYTSSKYI